MGYYVTVEPNVKYYVEDLNPESKKTILFLHGWPGSHKLFEYQFDQLPKLGYRCIGIDTRGFGDMFFYQHITEAFSDWFFQLGLHSFRLFLQIKR